MKISLQQIQIPGNYYLFAPGKKEWIKNEPGEDFLFRHLAEEEITIEDKAHDFSYFNNAFPEENFSRMVSQNRNLNQWMRP